jgi:hypothetical protein
MRQANVTSGRREANQRPLCRPGEPAEATVTFTNRTGEPIQVIVVQSDCSCVTAEVPVWIAPGEARAVRVEVRPPKEPGPFVRKIGWLTTATAPAPPTATPTL